MSCANSSCKNCNGICNEKQNLCKINSQNASVYGDSFSWPTAPAATSVPISKVWTAEAWNQLKDAVNAAYNAGSSCSSSGQVFSESPMKSASVDQPITAEIFNSAKEAINKLGGSIEEVTGGPTGTIIRAYHATSMQDGYNNGQIHTLACDTCNTQCNAQCDGCIGCVNCQGVEHYNTCYGSCDSP